MKKAYVTPTMQLYAISAEERIAADCWGDAHFTQFIFGCNVLLTNGLDDGSCVGGQPFGSQ